MVITYYADMIFAWNFILDYILIVLIHPEQKKKYLRIGVASFVGAFFTLAVLYWWRGNIILYYFLRFLCAVLMCAISIQFNGFGEFLCNTFLLYGAGGSICGIYTLLTASHSGFFGCDTISLVASAGLIMCIRKFLAFRKKANLRYSCLAEVCLKNHDVEICEKAFYDSGNHLYEPISGKSVILIRSDVMKNLGIRQETFRMVPYSSVGNDSGLLKAYRLDELVVGSGKCRKLYKDIYAAVAEEKLFRLEGCDVILHSEHVQ